MDQKTRKLIPSIRDCIPETDYMYPEEREEEDLPTLKTALRHRYNISMTTQKSAEDD